MTGYTAGVTFALKVVVTPTSMTFYVNGSQVNAITDSTFGTASGVGLLGYWSTSPILRCTLDDLLVQ